MTRPLVLLLSSCLATTAAAQTLTATLTVAKLDSYTVGPKDCGQNVAVVVNWELTAATCDDTLNLWVTSGTCGNDPVDLVLFDGRTITATSGTAAIPVDDLPVIGDAGLICGSTATSLRYRVCGSFKPFSGLGCGEPQKMSSPPTLDYDGVPPDAPRIESLAGVDNGLIATVSPATGTANVRLEYKLQTEDDTAYREAVTYSASATKATIEGLINNTVYSVRAIGIDDAKNESVPSTVLEGAPVNSQGFFGYYVDRGGSEMGGCSTAGGVAILPAALVALWSILRRRRS